MERSDFLKTAGLAGVDGKITLPDRPGIGLRLL